jgi:A/G-specific adenine glycosylase
MELGALVCTTNVPRCSTCPVATRCQGRRLGLQEQIPARSPAPETVRVQEAGVVVRRGGNILLVQRPANGRWAGLWEVPHGPLEPGEEPPAAAKRLLRALTTINAKPGAEILTIRHTVTRFHITLICLEARYRSGNFRSDFYRQAAWATPADTATYPVSRPQRRLAEALNLPERQGRLF